jgi:hypothetical protein
VKTDARRVREPRQEKREPAHGGSVEEGSGRRVLTEPYHRVRNPRAGGAIWEPSRGKDGGAAGDTGNSQRYCDSARTEPGRRLGCEKNRELATPADLRCEKGKTARTRRASRTEGTTEEKIRTTAALLGST